MGLVLLMRWIEYDVRDENGKLFIRNLEISILCDDLLDICENRKEVDSEIKSLLYALVT